MRAVRGWQYSCECCEDSVPGVFPQDHIAPDWVRWPHLESGLTPGSTHPLRSSYKGKYCWRHSTEGPAPHSPWDIVLCKAPTTDLSQNWVEIFSCLHISSLPHSHVKCIIYLHSLRWITVTELARCLNTRTLILTSWLTRRQCRTL